MFNESVFIEKKEILTPLTYHHARPLESVLYGPIRQKSPLEYMQESDRDVAKMFDDSYRWLQDKLGFYPLFMAVGRQEEDLRMTGYQAQWRKRKNREVRRNDVMFSYRNKPGDGVFLDFDYWHLVLNNSDIKKDSKEWGSLFRPSFIKHDWVSYANKHPHSVQLVVPELDLSAADQVMVRNEETKKRLEAMGFRNVLVARLKVES